MGIQNAPKTRPGTLPNAPRATQGSRSKIKFGCGHRGMGSYCHRCDRADILEDRIAKKIFMKQDKTVKAMVESDATKDQLKAMTAEAAHLRTVGRPVVKKPVKGLS